MIKLRFDLLRKMRNVYLLLWKKFTTNYRNEEEKGFGIQGIDMFY